MIQRLEVKRSSQPTRGRLLSAIRTYLPGAWIQPSSSELVALYRLRYKMALEEQKYDAAMIFLNKILEVEPLDAEAKLSKGELYHRHLRDYSRAVEQYSKVIRLSVTDERAEAVRGKAKASLTEIMEMLS